MPQCASEIFTPKRTFNRPGQDRVADVAVQPRHRLAVDRPFEARAHHEVVALRQAVDEWCEVLHRYVSSASPITMKSPRATASPAR